MNERSKKLQNINERVNERFAKGVVLTLQGSTTNDQYHGKWNSILPAAWNGCEREK